MKDPPATNSRQSPKDPPVGLRRSAAPNSREIPKELAELPPRKRRCSSFFQKNCQMESSNQLQQQQLPAIAAMEADGSDESPGAETTTDVGTQTDQPTPALVPKSTGRLKKIRDEQLIPLDEEAFRSRRDGSTRKGQNTHGRNGSATRAGTKLPAKQSNFSLKTPIRRQNKWLWH